jgi:hypothetical protein
MPDLIITGIPRSGTSLAAAIIDGAPDSRASFAIQAR